MHLSREELRKIDKQFIDSLPGKSAKELCLLVLDDLKELHEWLGQNSENSSMPPGSNFPWARFDADGQADEEEPDEEQNEPAHIKLDDSDEESAEHDEDADKSDQQDSPQNTDDRPKGNKPGKQPGATGHGRTQKLPVHDTIIHKAGTCSACNLELDETCDFTARTGHYVIDIEVGDDTGPGIEVINTKHIYGDTTCGGCGHVNRLMPHRLEKNEAWGVEVSQWHLVGPTLVALIVCLSKRMRLSRRRIREFLHDWLRLDLCIGTINKCIHEAGRAVSPLTDELLEEVRESLILFVDETSWKEWGKKRWLWVFTSLKVTFYIIGFRSQKVLDYVLGQTFKGVLMSDGYRAYRKFLNRLRCWAHLLRKTKGLKQSLSYDPRTFGTEAHAVLTELMDVIYKAREGPPTDLLPIYREFLAEFKECCMKYRDSDHKKTRELAREFLNDWDTIFHVLLNPTWPLTNNEAERALRHWVIARKLSHGTRNGQGSRVFAILASVIDTCRKRNACPWKYLAEVITARRQGLDVPPLPLAA